MVEPLPEIKYKDGRGESKHKWELVYDAGDALEPFYYKAVDLLRDVFKMDVRKIADWFAFSERSEEWGRIEAKRHMQVADARTLLLDIQSMFKSLIGMRKDLQRVMECLDYYKKEKETPPDLILKGVWVDRIDSQLGAASIHQLTLQMQFLPLRDWFFRCESDKEVDKLPTNVRIKNILKRKLKEYKAWKKEWRKSLEEMKEVLKERIDAQKATINLYKEWAKPLIRNITVLEQKIKEPGVQPPFLSPDLIRAGESVYSYVKLIAFKRDPGKFPGHIPCVEVDFVLRGSSPRRTMKTIMMIRPIVYKEEAFEEKLEQWEKDPVEEWFKKLFLVVTGERVREKVRKKKRGLLERLSWKRYKGEKAAIREAHNIAWDLYDIMKKAFGLEAWPVPRKF
jgi:hypothetical protein